MVWLRLIWQITTVMESIACVPQNRQSSALWEKPCFCLLSAAFLKGAVPLSAFFFVHLIIILYFLFILKENDQKNRKMCIVNEKSEAIKMKKKYMCVYVCVWGQLYVNKRSYKRKGRRREKKKCKKGRSRSDARICSNMDKIENELFIYSCIIGERRNESFIFSLNDLIHVNKKI